MLVRLGLRVSLTGLALLTLAVAAGGAACSKNFDEPDSSEEVPRRKRGRRVSPSRELGRGESSTRPPQGGSNRLHPAG